MNLGSAGGFIFLVNIALDFARVSELTFFKGVLKTLFC